jgi:hypothetical protein
VTYKKTLYLFGKESGSGKIYGNRFDGSQWEGWELVGGQMTVAGTVSVANYQDALYLFGKSSSDDNLYMKHFDGQT